MATKRTLQNKLPHITTKPDYVFWSLSVFIILFLTIIPFNTALFNGGLIQYEKPIYYSILFGSIAIFIVAVTMLFSKKDIFTDPLLHIMVWLIPLSLFISSLNAASHMLAVNGVYIYLLLAGMFVFARFITSRNYGHAILLHSLIGTGYVIVIFGFMNWFGDASLFGLINYSEIPGQFSRVYHDAVLLDSNGARLTSVFQYANTYAAYLAGLLFCTLYLIVSSKRKYIVITSSLMLVPILLSLLLTLSRGGWATALIAYLLVLVFIHTHKQLLTLLYSFVGLVVTIVIFSSVNKLGNDLRETFSSSSYIKAWLILIIASTFITIVSLVLHKYIHSFVQNKCANFSSKRWVSSLIPALLLVLGVGLGYLLLQDTAINRALPDNIEQRVDNINLSQHSVLERGTFYTDALKLFGDYPILGRGAGTWAALYEQYQNNPYSSNQAHNFFMQHLVETGLLGTLILLSFLIVVLFQYARTRFMNWKQSTEEYIDSPTLYFLFALPILIHSAIDFDMSYVYIGVVVFLCLGAMSMNSQPLLDLKPSTMWRRIYHASIIVLSLIMLFGSTQLLRADSFYKLFLNRINAAQSIEHFMEPINNAIAIRDGNPYYTLSKSDILNQLHSQFKDEMYYSENLELINKSLHSEPYNLQLLNRKMQLLLSKNELEQAFANVSQTLSYYPWKDSVYTNHIILAMQLAENEIKAQNWPQLQYYIQEVISSYTKLHLNIEHLKTLPEGQLQGNSFSTNTGIELGAAKALYYNNQFEASVAILKPLIANIQAVESMDSDQQEIARWYIAGLEKQGLTDATLLDSLAALDPQSKNLIHQLVSLELPN